MHRITLVVLFFICAYELQAKETLKVSFGDRLAPWVIPETGNGIIIDILTTALEPSGYNIEAEYLPYARRLKAYHQGLVDVVSDVNPNTIKNEHLQGFFSGPAYKYENYAFSLSKRNYQFNAIADLINLRLLSWQGAIAHLGDEYAEMATNNPFYSETHDQSAQVKLLFLERVDVIQLDLQIFKYYLAHEINKGVLDTSAKVDRFALFGSSPNGFLFRSIKVRDEFTKQLEKMRSDGRYQKIIERYQ